jgi:hypothetical protein
MTSNNDVKIMFRDAAHVDDVLENTLQLEYGPIDRYKFIRDTLLEGDGYIDDDVRGSRIIRFPQCFLEKELSPISFKDLYWWFP